MKKATEVFIEEFHKEQSKHSSSRDAFNSTTQKWKDQHGFDPPSGSLRSLQKLIPYHKNK
jgi:hypothetical protein